ncbi:MAG: hypothetical protein ACRDOF_00275 [Gaiellaceae bacterium]
MTSDVLPMPGLTGDENHVAVAQRRGGARFNKRRQLFSALEELHTSTIDPDRDPLQTSSISGCGENGASGGRIRRVARARESPG